MVTANALYQRKRRAKSRGLGICIHCCCRPATPGFTSCEPCRTAIRIRMSIHTKAKLKDRPDKPDKCPICGDGAGILYWHHWDDEHPSIGIWVCPHCNIIVELEDRGLVERYKELKSKFYLT